MPFVYRWVLVWHSDGSNVWLVVFFSCFWAGAAGVAAEYTGPFNGANKA